MPQNKPYIAVGYDGSTESIAAVRWAAGWALATDRGIKVLYATPTAPDARLQVMMHEAAVKDVRALVKKLTTDFPGLEVSYDVKRGGAAATLVKAAREHDVVMGSRGYGAVRGLLLGSVPAAVVSNARGHAVTVVPPEYTEFTPGKRVVVGFDGSKGSQRAARYGFDQAQQLGLPVLGVIGRPMPVGPGYSEIVAHTTFEDDVADRAKNSWETLASQYPDVESSFQVVPKPPSMALLDAAQDACFVTMGSRGLGGFTSLMLGSNSRDLLSQAGCVVSVIRPEKDDVE